jgi:apolipoprotein N-acyltransferase
MNKTLKYSLISLKNLILFSIIGGLAFSPFNQPIALFFSIYVLLTHIQTQSSFYNFFKRTFTFFFFFFLTQLYWVAWAFNVYGIPEAMPIGLICMPIIVGLFPTVFIFPSYFFKENTVAFAWVFFLGWCLSEVARSFLFTGFPWNLNGYVWDLPLLQSTRFFGIFGLSFLTTAAAVVLYTKQKWLGIGIFGALLCFWIEGNHRLKSPQLNTDICLRLIQPSVDQREKWHPEFFEKNLSILEILSGSEAEKPIDITIWPEAAITIPLDAHVDFSTHLGGFISQGYLITGAPRRMHNPEKAFSCLQVIDNKGLIHATFDKFHLVPFGEYVPLRSLNPLPKLTDGTLDYSPGTGPRTIRVSGIPPFSPLICYEAIFSGAIIDPTDRPQWLLNITNDAWYGITSGPYQHLKIVQVRAIEEGLPLIRVANNGVSAVIDSYGRILQELELNKIGFIDAHLPTPLPQTLYRGFINYLHNSNLKTCA